MCGGSKNFFIPPPKLLVCVWGGGLKTETGKFLLHFQNSKSSNRCRSVYGTDIMKLVISETQQCRWNLCIEEQLCNCYPSCILSSHIKLLKVAWFEASLRSSVRFDREKHTCILQKLLLIHLQYFIVSILKLSFNFTVFCMFVPYCVWFSCRCRI